MNCSQGAAQLVQRALELLAAAYCYCYYREFSARAVQLPHQVVTVSPAHKKTLTIVTSSRMRSVRRAGAVKPAASAQLLAQLASVLMEYTSLSQADSSLVAMEKSSSESMIRCCGGARNMQRVFESVRQRLRMPCSGCIWSSIPHRPSCNAASAASACECLALS